MLGTVGIPDQLIMHIPSTNHGSAPTNIHASSCRRTLSGCGQHRNLTFAAWPDTTPYLVREPAVKHGHLARHDSGSSDAVYTTQVISHASSTE